MPNIWIEALMPNGSGHICQRFAMRLMLVDKSVWLRPLHGVHLLLRERQSKKNTIFVFSGIYGIVQCCLQKCLAWNDSFVLSAMTNSNGSTKSKAMNIICIRWTVRAIIIKCIATNKKNSNISNNRRIINKVDAIYGKVCVYSIFLCLVPYSELSMR